MNDVLELTLTGRLAAKPELRYTSSGQSVTNFSVYSNQRFTNKQGEVVKKNKRTRVVVWGKQAENACQYLDRGRKIFLKGTPQTREWTDREGVVHQIEEVKASFIEYLDRPKSNQDVPEGEDAPPPMDEDAPQDQEPELPDHRDMTF